MTNEKLFLLLLFCIFLVPLQGSGCGLESPSSFQGDHGPSSDQSSPVPPPSSSQIPTPSPKPDSTPSSTTPFPTPSAPQECGNGKVDMGELCDGESIGELFGKPLDCTMAKTIEKKRFLPAEGKVKCKADCTLDTSECKPLCGNGRLDPQEDCDAGTPSQDARCTDSCEIKCLEGEVPIAVEGNGTDARNNRFHCYQDVNTPKTYKEAEQSCQSIGGHLLILESEKEWIEIVGTLLQRDLHSPRWIGLRRGVNPDPQSITNYYDNFYWTGFSWGIANPVKILPQLAWKGRTGRAPTALVPPYEFLQSLWNLDEPNDCGGVSCLDPERSVEMLGSSSGHLLNDQKEDELRGFLCEFEPPTLY